MVQQGAIYILIHPSNRYRLELGILFCTKKKEGGSCGIGKYKYTVLLGQCICTRMYMFFCRMYVNMYLSKINSINRKWISHHIRVTILWSSCVYVMLLTVVCCVLEGGSQQYGAGNPAILLHCDLHCTRCEWCARLYDGWGCLGSVIRRC